MRNEKNLILINANQPEEARVALLEENKLLDLDIEYSRYKQKKSNIYKGKISRIEPSLEAVFIDYGAEHRHGFLPIKEISPIYFHHKHKENESPTHKNSLQVGQEIMIQIEREERGNKGAALTTYITLPGSYLVLMPNNPGANGISRRIEGNERREMQDLLNQLSTPENMGLILRTAGVGRELNELKNDLSLLLDQWETIKKVFKENKAPSLIFQEGDLVTRSIRDYLSRDVNKIIIDDEKTYEKVKHYIKRIRPDFVQHVFLYKEAIPLFMHFGVEKAVESAFQRELRLPSGGTIIIDRTEALVAIDINSGRSTKNEDIEETAIKTNLEAAEEIAHQLCIRDLGGLIVIDFIDMSLDENKRKVENRLREAAKKDRARLQMGRISSFGLLEMSRQRLRPSLGKANETFCERCHGQGTIRSVESLALSLIRSIEKEALRESVQRIQVEVPIDIATYLINEKRTAINQIEQRHKVDLLLIPHPYWQSPQYKLTVLENDMAMSREEGSIASYHLLKNKTPLIKSSSPYISTTNPSIAKPAARESLAFPDNKNRTKNRLGVLSRLFSMLTELTKPKKEEGEKLAEIPSPQRKEDALSSRRQPYYGRSNQGNKTKGNKRGRELHNNRHSMGQKNPTKKQTYLSSSRIERVERKVRNSLEEEVTLSTGAENTIARKKPNNVPLQKSIKSIKEKIPISTTRTLPITIPEAKENNQKNHNKILTNSDITPIRRKTTRRYGGEPKLRCRTYTHGATQNKNLKY